MDFLFSLNEIEREEEKDTKTEKASAPKLSRKTISASFVRWQ